jgi:transcriptional regulator with XRE-family HTH domain
VPVGSKRFPPSVSVEKLNLEVRNERYGSREPTGVFRCLTLNEIATGVAHFRKSLGWKQLALAMEAGVTERTVQRVERGEKVDEDTLRKIGRALRLQEDAFVGPRYVPTPDEAFAAANEYLTKLFETKRPVDLQAVTTAMDLEQVLLSHGYLIDTTSVGEAAQQSAGYLKDLIQDWGDLYSDLSHSERHRACMNVLETIREIERHGYTARCGAYKTDDAFDVGILFLLPTKDSHTCSLKQTLAPRTFTQLMNEFKLDF